MLGQQLSTLLAPEKELRASPKGSKDSLVTMSHECPTSSHLALKKQLEYAKCFRGAAPLGVVVPNSPRLTGKVTRGHGHHWPSSLATSQLTSLQVPGVLGPG